MADFKVQHKTAVIALNGASVTITAGTEYTAPSSITKAFIRIVGIENNTTGNEDSDFNGQANRNATVITNPSNLLTSITFTRTQASSGPLSIAFEIIEYIGSASGANEFIVRHEEAVTYTTALTVDSSTISGVSTAADVVVFSTGLRVNASGRVVSGDGRHTWEYISGSTLARGTQDNSFTAGVESIAVVEFTGSGWTVQRIEHTFVAAATIETETITTVTDITEAFTHHQSAYSTAENGPDGSGFEAYLTAATTITYRAAVIDSGQRVVSWIINNSNLSVERIVGSRADNAGGGTDPDTFTESHSATAATLAEVSIMGESGETDKTNDSHLVRMSMQPSSLTVIDMFRSRDEGNRDYRFEVVSWPAAVTGANPKGIFGMPLNRPLRGPL